MISGKNGKRRTVRVCVVSSAHPSSDPRIFHKQAKTLAANGYDVRFVVQHPYSETVDGVRIIPLPKPLGRRQRMTQTMLGAFVQALRQRAAVYHLHDPELLPAGVLLKLLTGARVIYDAHEDYPQDILTKYWLPSALRQPVALTFRAIEELIVRYLDAVVAATDTIAERFSPLTKTVSVRNYPILGLAAAIKTAESRRSEAQCYTAIYAGALTEIRGVKEMVEAAGLLGQRYEGKFRLKLLGRFRSEALEQAIMSLPGAAYVDYLGQVPYDEVYHHLTAADVGLVLLHPVPGYVEAMPNKLFEYMLAGLPVIASDFPMWQRIVDKEGCGLTANPLDPVAVSDAVAHLLEQPLLRQEMGERGRRAATEKYTWESEAKHLLALYEELLT